MKTTAEQRLLNAWAHRHTAPQALDALMDEWLSDETLEVVLRGLQGHMAPEDFDHLVSQAIHRAEQFREETPDGPRVHMLLGCPILGDDRAMPALTAAFWSRLEAWAQAAWKPDRADAFTFTPVGPLVRIPAITQLNIKAWHRLLRDAATQAPHAPARERLLSLHQLHDRPNPHLAHTDAMVVSQRIQLICFSYDPTAFGQPPRFEPLFRAALDQPDTWSSVPGDLPPFTQVVPPQRLRSALAVAMSQYLEAHVTVGLLHRQLPRQGKLDWVEGDGEEQAFNMLPRHNGRWLDPVSLSGSWVNAVGVALIDQVLTQVQQVFARAPAEDPEETPWAAVTERVLQ